MYLIIGKRATRTGVLTNYGHIPALFLFYKKDAPQRNLPLPLKKTTNSSLASNAGTIVPFLGNEKSEEMLTEIACAINAQKALFKLLI